MKSRTTFDTEDAKATRKPSPTKNPWGRAMWVPHTAYLRVGGAGSAGAGVGPGTSHPRQGDTVHEAALRGSQVLDPVVGGGGGHQGHIGEAVGACLLPEIPPFLQGQIDDDEPIPPVGLGVLSKGCGGARVGRGGRAEQTRRTNQNPSLQLKSGVKLNLGPLHWPLPPNPPPPPYQHCGCFCKGDHGDLVEIPRVQDSWLCSFVRLFV